MRIKFNMNAIKEKTNSLNVGELYFLSNFYAKEGCTVKVLSKSTATNSCGFPSSVKVQVIEQLDIPNYSKDYYAIGKVLVVNACNLYKNRYDASSEAKFKNLR